MRKITYPFETEEEKESFLEKYLEIFENKKNVIDEICIKINSSLNYKSILTGSFEQLIEFAIKYDKNRECSNWKELNNIFNYDSYRTKISNFIMSEWDKKENQESKVELNTCYYCSIDFINKISISYYRLEDFIKFATKEEWEKIDKNVGGNIYDNLKNINSLKNKIDLLNTDIIYKINEVLEQEKEKNHFTLDHVLPKADYPFLSLSLFNLVPCCSPCNSKFKLTKNFSISEEYFNKVVPSSDNHELEELLKFKILRDTSNLENFVSSIKKVEDLDIKLTNSNNDVESVNEYVHLFQLKGRYEFHKGKAFELIKKREKYSDSEIQKIANLVGYDFKTVKKDIFGKDCFESNNEPFEKYKQDIAKQLGII